MANGHNLFVFFDLVHPTDNYDRLTRAIQALGTPVKLSAALWFVDAPMGAKEAEVLLEEMTNPGDSLIVMDTTANFATSLNVQPMTETLLHTLWNGHPPQRSLLAASIEPSVSAPEHGQRGWLGRLFASERPAGTAEHLGNR